jgi:hypothetical protein
MLEKYREWWHSYILTKTPPPVQTYDDVRAMITAPSGTIVVGDEIARWYKEFKDIGEEIGKSGDMAKRRDQLKVMILNEARTLESTLDDESTDKWIFRDEQGNKLGSYGKNTKGTMSFR